ncbi:MAG: hypothetical protein KHW86_17330 [Porphyromonadaceae bacterium]|nr:hypothetical protein [Porphyromonadaceae bacterium]
MRDQGFIKLSRKFFENALWKEHRQYSRSEAWLDLIQMAGFEDSKYILNNRAIEVQRGEIVASRRFLENRWLWGSTKVTNFLDYLKKEGMINQRQTNGQTIITLCNYDTYNTRQTSDDVENKPATNQRQTRGKPPTNQNKEYKESKEGKESKEYIPPISPEGEIEIPFDESFETSCKPQGEKEKSSAKKEKEPNYSFDEFWELYDKKTGERKKLTKKWLALTDEEREMIMNYIPKYIECQPDKQFRKNPETFLNNKSWNDELIPTRDGNRQLPASDQGNAGRNNNPPVRTNANDKKTERDRLNEMARAILRGSSSQNT